MRNSHLAPLHVQAEQLQRSLERREKRRNQDRQDRNEHADVYEDGDRGSKRPTTGAPSAAVAALAAIQASNQTPQILLTCDLCQATFTSTIQHQQHLVGPVHRKAVQRQEAEAARLQRMAPYNHAAEAALGAAAWNTTHGGTAGPRPGPRPAPGDTGPSAPAAQQQQQRGAGAGQGPGALKQRFRNQEAQEVADAAARRQAESLSHADLVAKAQVDDGPLSIGGWVPPSISLAPVQSSPAPAPQDKAEEGKDAAAPQQARPTAVAGKGRGGGSDEDSDGPGGGLLGLAYGADSDGEASGAKSGGESSSSDGEDDGGDGGPVSFF